MRRLILVALIVATCTVGLTGPATAKSLKPSGVTTGQWVDYCSHSSDLVITLNLVVENGQRLGDDFNVEGFAKTQNDLHHDAVKIRRGNAKFSAQIQKLSDAVGRLKDDYALTGKLKFRGLSIASDPLPDCP